MLLEQRTVGEPNTHTAERGRGRRVMMATSATRTSMSQTMKRPLIRRRPTPSLQLSFSTIRQRPSFTPSSSCSPVSSWISSSLQHRRGRYQRQQPHDNQFLTTTTIATTTTIRSITTKSAARRLLGLKSESFTVHELRHAYFKMAKSTHPDMKKQFDDVETVDDADAGAKAFLDVTRAYELLLGCSDSCHDNNTFRIPVEEEEEYRRACQLILGIDATIVEESKTNPMFLHWLMGNTDGAQHWRSFFAVHGGLAQKLRPPAGYLHDGDQEGASSRSKPRRQRPPRR